MKKIITLLLLIPNIGFSSDVEIHKINCEKTNCYDDISIVELNSEFKEYKGDDIIIDTSKCLSLLSNEKLGNTYEQNYYRSLKPRFESFFSKNDFNTDQVFEIAYNYTTQIEDLKFNPYNNYKIIQLQKELENGCKQIDVIK